jgi:hypothetical protein
MAALRSTADHFVRNDARKYRGVTQTDGELAVRKSRGGAARDAASSKKNCARNDRPVRGDNRTGQAIWALGVDGRSRRIQPMGRDYRSHIDKSQYPLRTFKLPGDFFNPVLGGDCRKITAQQAVLQRLRPIFPLPSKAGGHSVPGSRKRYRQTGRAPALFLPQACRKPRQAELPAWRSPR